MGPESKSEASRTEIEQSQNHRNVLIATRPLSKDTYGNEIKPKIDDAINEAYVEQIANRPPTSRTLENFTEEKRGRFRKSLRSFYYELKKKDETSTAYPRSVALLEVVKVQNPDIQNLDDLHRYFDYYTAFPKGKVGRPREKDLDHADPRARETQEPPFIWTPSLPQPDPETSRKTVIDIPLFLSNLAECSHDLPFGGKKIKPY